MNHYETLNIPKTATPADIKRAYFGMVKKHTPDADPKGFKNIRTAYETLFNEDSRNEYDKHFVQGVSSEVQEIILTTQSMIEQNNYKAALNFIQEAAAVHQDSADITRLHAECLWKVKKSGIADTTLKTLLTKDPSDIKAHMLRAKIAASRGHVNKAGEHFRAAIKIDPLNPDPWVMYLRTAISYKYLDKPPCFIMDEAMELSPHMFAKDYDLYIWGIVNDLFSIFGFQGEHKPLPYYDLFAEHFIADDNHSEATFFNTLNVLSKIVDVDHLHTIHFLGRVLPTLEQSPHRHTVLKGSHYTVNFKLCYLRGLLALGILRNDPKIHNVLADLTSELLEETPDKNEKLSMERYIADNLTQIRPSLEVLQTNYPDYFTLNQAFYTACLTPQETITRTAPKTGRNDPCTCGSGMKFKKCCG